MKFLLVEFERRYKGVPSETMEICAKIADKYGMDLDEVADYIYINRYEEYDEALSEEPTDKELENLEV